MNIQIIRNACYHVNYWRNFIYTILSPLTSGLSDCKGRLSYFKDFVLYFVLFWLAVENLISWCMIFNWGLNFHHILYLYLQNLGLQGMIVCGRNFELDWSKYIYAKHATVQKTHSSMQQGRNYYFNPIPFFKKSTTFCQGRRISQ